MENLEVEKKKVAVLWLLSQQKVVPNEQVEKKEKVEKVEMKKRVKK
jgi:hypothetical protein